MSLRTKYSLLLILAFLLLALTISALQIFWVGRLVIHHANERIEQNIQSAWRIYEDRQRELEIIVSFLAERFEASAAKTPSATFDIPEKMLDQDRFRWGLDVLTVVKRQDGSGDDGALKLVQPAGEKDLCSGTVIISNTSMQRLGGKADHEETMMVFATRSLGRTEGDEESFLVAGIDLRKAEALVDEMQNVLFKDHFYKGKRMGTVTIFMDTQRIATTVLLEQGGRAVGTLVSQEVATQTLHQGIPWTGRAWVVENWYLSRYDPILDPKGHIIGMLYIGELEERFRDMQRDSLLIMIGVILVIMAVAVLIRYRLTGRLIRQIEALQEGTAHFIEGNYQARVSANSLDELGALAQSFNTMAQVIEEERSKLVEQKQELERVNLNYMEMLGFITHEMRSTLGAAIFNIASLKEGSYGPLIEDQREGVELIENSLAHLDSITNNYLQLAQIENGDLVINKSSVDLRYDVITPVLAGLQGLLDSRGMQVKVKVPEDLSVPADINLIRVVYENLLGNALKYGKENGTILLDGYCEEQQVFLSVWNDGKVIEEEHLPTLFHQFRRYDVDERTGRKGTGLGLFIVKQIVTIHGGVVSVESDPERGTRFTFSLPR